MQAVGKRRGKKQISNQLDSCLMSHPVESSDEFCLTVIVAFDGQQTGQLNELLLCLSAQDCVQFEVLIVVRNAGEELMNRVTHLCWNLESISGVNTHCVDLKEKSGSSVIPNCVFKLMNGTHFSIVQQGDLLFDNFVSSFKTLAHQFPNRVLFSYPLRQEWCTVNSEEGWGASLKAVGFLNNCYCHAFNYSDQTQYNDCPQSSLAFPASVINNLGLRFEEKLPTLADWDFLMHAVALCGVSVAETPSLIMRAWKTDRGQQCAVDRDASLSLEYQNLSERLDLLPCISPYALGKERRLTPRSSLFSPEFLREHCFLVSALGEDSGRSNFNFVSLPSYKAGYDLLYVPTAPLTTRVLKLMFTDMTSLTLRHFKILMIDDNEQEQELSLDSCMHHGLQVDGRHILLLGEKPTIQFEVPADFRAQELHVAITGCEKVEDIYLNRVLKSKHLVFFERCLRYLKRRFLAQ